MKTQPSITMDRKKTGEAATAERYGFLWSRQETAGADKKYHFDYMQEVIPEKIVRGSVGLDIGCGSGLDVFNMARNNSSVRIIGMDISDGIYAASHLNRDIKNAALIKGSASDIPLKDGSCDFVYSFGALHHMPDHRRGFSEMARVLKSGSPCFLYLYEDHADNIIKYIGIKIICFIRKVTVTMPPRIIYGISFLLSPSCVLLFSYPAKIFKRFRFTYGLYEKMPFNFGTSLFSLQGDIYDRFAAPVEFRFGRRDLCKTLVMNNFTKINIIRLKAAAGWVAWAYKKGSNNA